MKKALLLAVFVLIPMLAGAIRVCSEQDYWAPHYPCMAHCNCPYARYTEPEAERVVTWEIEISEARGLRIGVSSYRRQPAYYPTYYPAYYYTPLPYYRARPHPARYYQRYPARYPAHHYRSVEVEYEQPVLAKKVYTRSGVIWLK